MSPPKSGGPAFPVSDVMALEPRTTAEMVSLAHGMTLRDYFAAKAMQGLLSAPGDYSADADTSAPMASWDDFAAGAYQLADAMLAVRVKP